MDEAERLLAAIRGCLLMSTRETGVRSLEEALRHVQALNTSAGAFDMPDIQSLAGRLATDLEWIVSTGKPVLGDVSRPLLDILVKMEAGVGKTRMELDDLAFDVSDFIDESFENLIAAPQKPSAMENPAYTHDPETEPMGEMTVEDEWEDEFEIDEEMIEIFREEAEELLRGINENLGVLANEPNNREALLEMRRCEHTFKGSAGIVGLKKPSRLAHRVEDLLDHLAENQVDGTERVFELLLASSDCLSGLTNGDETPQLELKVARIYSDFDEMMAALTAPSPAPAKPEPLPVVVEPVKPKPIETAPQQAPAQNRPVVRVSLEKLDDLANIVRSLVMSRSVFEQRLAEFEVQVQELHNSTSRLQRSTSKLETDFEANMLGLSPSRNPLFTAPSAITGANQEAEFDTLEFDRYTDFHQTTRELLETASDNFAINSALDVLRGNLEGFFENQRRQIEDVQEKLQRIRMIEFGTLAARLNRTVRVTCEEEEKQAELVIEGEHLEIDTQILDSLIEPLMHLLRNAVAHGIETPDTRRLLGKPERGRIQLSATNEDTHILLTITDDGRGISTAELKEAAIRNGYLAPEEADSVSEEQILDLVFQAGLTTASEVTQTAGRGVGMNIVRTSIERQQGTVSVSSEPQKGTIFTIQMPLSLAVTRVLLVKANRQTFAFPLKKVKQVHDVEPGEAGKLLTDKTVVLDGTKYPVSSLNEHLGFGPSQNPANAASSLLVVEVTGRSFALLVDEVIKPEEVLIKPLGQPLENLKGIFGATILGNGQVVPVLDLTWYLRSRSKKSKAARAVEAPRVEARQLSVMIVDDSPSVRHLNTRMVRNAGWLPIVARDGVEALEMLRSCDAAPDIILSDVEMPRMDGYELLATLRKSGAWESIPVVMITSRAGEKHKEKAIELGVSEYLVKPYDDVKLLEIVKNLTHNSQL